MKPRTIWIVEYGMSGVERCKSNADLTRFLIHLLDMYGKINVTIRREIAAV